MRQLKITSSITNRDGSTIEKYFTEVSREPMVTAEEEVILAQRIKQGDHAALERLVKANLRFVVSVAKQYQHGKIPLNDLINEGNLGLIKAAKMFDETRGFKFISYAVWWIRQSIMQALAEHSRLVRIPVNKVAELSKIKNAASIIEQKSEREASPDELADFLQISVDDIRNIQVAAIKQSSLDAPFDEDNGNSLIDVLSNPNSEATDKVLDGNSSLKIEMERLLTLLNEREKDVVKRFFGIGYDYSFTLEDIAADLKLTRERVRQIKENALKKLNFEANMKLLKPYLCAC